MNIEPSKKLQGLSGYAFKEINDRVAALKDAGVTPIDFGVGDPSEPTPEFVIEALGEAAKKHAGTGYPSYTGGMDYLQACADYMSGRFDVELDPATEMCSNIGSKKAIFNFPEGFINPGDYVIVPSPGYPPMKTGTIFAEGIPFFVPLLAENDWLVDYESVPDDIASKAKIIWINYPNSPTGAVASREYYEGLIEWAHKNDIIIAADEGCYIDLYFGEKPLSILEVAREGIVAFYSLSKRNNMTGYRAGFVCGDEKIIEIYKALKTNIDSGTPNFVQDAAVVALNDEAHAESMRNLYEEKGSIILEALEAAGMDVRKPSATFYIWQKVPAGMTDVDFAKKLLDPEFGIVVTPGSLISDECEVSGGGDGVSSGAAKINPGAGYVRFALMPTMDEVKAAAEKIKKCFS